LPAKSVLKLSTFRIGEKRKPSEGLRLGTVRFLPRGIPKKDYARRDQFDVWFPLLAPSRELFRWFMSKPRDDRRFAQFARRYQKEMSAGDKHQAIATLGLIAGRTPIAVGCYCQTPHCHRFVLEQLIRDVAEGTSRGA
jgi:uncharacterized protein YeaO (DUF488 family)